MKDFGDITYEDAKSLLYVFKTSFIDDPEEFLSKKYDEYIAVKLNCNKMKPYQKLYTVNKIAYYT